VDEMRDGPKGKFVRSRLVATEVNTYHGDDVNAGTSPLSLVRLVVSLAASKVQPRALAFHDASVAFFHAQLDEDIAVSRPPAGTARPGHVWQLNKALYGTRRASQLWQEYVADMFTKAGWRRLRVSAGLYYNDELGTATAVHGDDFLSEGD
jgi:hypothetical protein